MIHNHFPVSCIQQAYRPLPLTFNRVRERGASMIEVLVAVLVVSVGLLGIAGLAGATFNYNKVSQLRLTGIALVNDLADRARVNVYGYDLGAYDLAIGDDAEASPVTVASTSPNFNLQTTTAGDANTVPNATAVATALAAADVDQFLRSVSSRLPQGDAIVISRPTQASRDLDVWLLWKEGTVSNAGNDEDLDRGDFSLFDSSKENCPDTLTAAQAAEYSCMYFRVGL